MFRRFLADISGNYAIAFVAAMVPISGALAMAVDYAEMNRQRQATLNALDAAGIATARHVVSGASDEALIAYANDFFEANLGPVDPADTTLAVELPSTETGGGTLKLSATLDYEPAFLPVFVDLLKGTDGGDSQTISFSAETEIRLKNTLEVALVLDNSGSMDYLGSGSGQKRMTLLKAAAKQLVDTLADQANMIKQINEPVRFGLVPFAASVNVGPANAGAAWMDTLGLSPIHHENFDWTALDEPGKGALKVNGVWVKDGAAWGADEGAVLSRFSLYNDMKKVDSREWVSTGREWVCTRHRRNGTCREGEWRDTGYYDETIGNYASWQGCVEARPHPYNVTDAAANAGVGEDGVGFGDPATLFVPMFAPDEPGDRWATATDPDPDYFDAANNWWNDGSEGGGTTRLRNMKKYFEVRPYGASTSQGTGPNYSCTTNPITPLIDVSTETGRNAVKAAIDAMAANGGTNVPEGLAWGWRVVSGAAPFAEGRPDGEKGNDKVVIVLTDGENTYYTPGSLGFADPAGAKSIYSSYGYMNPTYGTTGLARLFLGTSADVGKYDYSNGNYTKALNEQMADVCANAKAAGLLVMTVSLDLDTADWGENKAIEALRECASESRFRNDPDDPSKPAKLYWNATGGNLAEKFKEIADELSNLRIVG